MKTLDPVSQTLFIPLSGRAYAKEFFPDLGFHDETATKWAETLAYDRDLFTSDLQAVRGSILRTQVFDQITRAFIARHPTGSVINFGAGLCTRYFRMQAPQISWYEIDRAEVIALKKTLCPETEKFRFINDLKSHDFKTPTLVLAEGVLMFLSETEVQSFFKDIQNAQQVVFDYLHPWVKRHAWLQPRSCRATGAHYTWAVRSLPQLVSQFTKFKLNQDRAMASSFPLSLRLLNQAARALSGSPLYEVAVLNRAL